MSKLKSSYRATLSSPGHGDGEGEQQHDEEEGHEPECPGDDVDLGLEVHGAALQVSGMIIVIANKRKNYLHSRHITLCHGLKYIIYCQL